MKPINQHTFVSFINGLIALSNYGDEPRELEPRIFAFFTLYLRNLLLLNKIQASHEE